MTVPKIHSSSALQIYSASFENVQDLPLADFGISAGFPSPALDFMGLTIDLNRDLIKNPPSTFYGRVSGVSMIDAGIGDGDLLIIDKSIEPVSGKIAVCVLDGEYTLKRLKVDDTGCWLMPANDKYKPIHVTEDNELTIWGIVTYVIKSF